MTSRVYNTLSKKKELFEPVRPGKVGIYLCGMTVYKSPHIGHMVGPIIFDAIKRYLVYKGFEVSWVVNITDVDDKLIDAAAKANAPMHELAEKYSAMSMKYLGQTFDMHGGGMDLMFPHHENELAQSESATGQEFVKFWMHNGITKVRTKARGGEWQAEDIHESAGTAVGVHVKDLIETHSPDVIRYLLLSSHYRRPIEFSDQAL